MNTRSIRSLADRSGRLGDAVASDETTCIHAQTATISGGGLRRTGQIAGVGVRLACIHPGWKPERHERGGRCDGMARAGYRMGKSVTDNYRLYAVASGGVR